MKDILDKATDLCETKGFLQKDVLEALNNYLKNNNNEILKNFPKFYEENKFNDFNLWVYVIENKSYLYNIYFQKMNIINYYI